MHNRIAAAIAILLSTAPASGQSAHSVETDTLLNVVQWPVSAGGNDHWYGIISLVKPWVDHRDLAGGLMQAGDTGYLATITSQAENDFVMSVVQNHTNQPSVADEFYIGGMRTGNGWHWLTGEPMSYTNWASGEPSGDGPALAIWGASQGGRAGLWNDVPEDTIGVGSIHQLWSVIEWGEATRLAQDHRSVERITNSLTTQPDTKVKVGKSEENFSHWKSV